MLMKFDIEGNVVEYQYQKVIQLLGMTDEQFLNFSILAGCDYLEKN